MEALSQQAFASLNLLTFLPNPTEHELVTFNPVFGAFTRESLPLPGIIRRFDSLARLPKFCLVKLQINYAHIPRAYEPPPAINASKDDLLHLWKTFNLDPIPLHLLGQRVWGPNHFPCATWDPQAEVFRFTMTSLNTYFLSWTYHPKAKSTSAVIITRPEAGGRNDWEDWFATLQLHSAAVEHVLCLLLTSAMQVMPQIWRATLRCNAFINETEARTGYNPWLPARGVAEFGLEELILASRGVGTVLVTLEDFERHVKLLRAVMDSAEKGGFVELGGEDGAGVQESMHYLTAQMADCAVRLAYLRERGKNQLPVIFSLLTRHDASSSIAVARAAKKDTTSMEVIAIMTMLFLPGTFLAAVFAVPSLKWDASPVWVFWVIAIPATFAVFAVWFWVSNKDSMSPVGPRNGAGGTILGRERELGVVAGGDLVLNSVPSALWSFKTLNTSVGEVGENMRV